MRPADPGAEGGGWPTTPGQPEGQALGPGNAAAKHGIAVLLNISCQPGARADRIIEKAEVFFRVLRSVSKEVTWFLRRENLIHAFLFV